jgi:hypothetical protein
MYSVDIAFVGTPEVIEGKHLVCVGSSGTEANPEAEYVEIEGLLVRFVFTLDHPGCWTITAMSFNEVDPQTVEAVSSDVLIHIAESRTRLK